MKRIKICIAIAGILVSLTGYYLDKADHFEWAVRIFAPQYKDALCAYETTLADHSWVERGQPGFSELSALLQPLLSGSGDLSVSRFRIKDNTWSVRSTDKGMESGPRITIEITVNDGRSTSASGIDDMRPQIKATYYDDTIFEKGQCIFLLGIALSMVALIPFKSKKNAGEDVGKLSSEAPPSDEVST